jgi:class III poly(R)-hydroxyalkanoic acid synthase PhaE subunit
MMEAAKTDDDPMDFQRAYSAWLSAMKLWQSPGPWSGPKPDHAGVDYGFGSFPGLMLGITKPVWEAFLNAQERMTNSTEKIGQGLSKGDLDEFQEHIFEAWKEIYDSEFKRFLNMPQMGLTRAYQQRFNQALDKFNVYNAALTEFFSLLSLPIEKSFQTLRQELSAMAEEGTTPTNSKDVYKLWLRILEKRYMSLFRSEDYNEQLARTLNTMAEFAMARERAMEDALQAIPAPTKKEMDELYKELYILKKRVKSLERNPAAGHNNNNGIE